MLLDMAEDMRDEVVAVCSKLVSRLESTRRDMIRHKNIALTLDNNIILNKTQSVLIVINEK